MIDVSQMKLGKKAAVHDPRTMRLADYVTNALQPPSRIDWSTKVAQLGVMLNDSLGCHDAQTEVLTDRGWQAWPNYDGSAMATMSPSTGLLEYQQPTALVRYDYDGPLYFADHKSLDFALTPNHRMYSRPYVIPYPYVGGSARYAGAYQFDEVAHIAHRSALPAAPNGHIGVDLRSVKIGERAWDGDDLLALLALVLSDGWIGGTEANWNTVSFCCFLEKRRDMVAALAYRLGIHEVPGRRGVWKFTDGALAAWLRSNASTTSLNTKAQFKRVPRIVHATSTRQVDRFLSFFGDQAHTSAERQFYSTSSAMIDDLQELLLLNGYRSSIYDRPARPTALVPAPREGAVEYTLTQWMIRDQVTLLNGGKKSNLVQDQYKGEVFCATVPNSTLITRRNGSVLISGNCCTIASAGHMIQTWTANNGSQIILPDSAILKGYEEACGYVAGDPSTDNGGVEITVLNYLRKTGLGGHKIYAYVVQEPGNKTHIELSVDLLGGCYLGLELPRSIQGQRVWSVPPGGPVGDGAPGSLGGHAVPAVAYGPAGITVITWGQLLTMTWKFFTTYCSESYGVLSPDWANGAKLAPNGFDLAQLQADLAAITG